MYSELLKKIDELQTKIDIHIEEKEMYHKIIYDIHKALFNPPKKKNVETSENNRTLLRGKLIKEHTRNR